MNLSLIAKSELLGWFKDNPAIADVLSLFSVVASQIGGLSGCVCYSLL